MAYWWPLPWSVVNFYYVGQMQFISGAGTRSMVVPAIIFRNFKHEEFFFLGLILTVLSVFFKSVIQYIVVL